MVSQNLGKGIQNWTPGLLNSDTTPLPYTDASLTSYSQNSCKYHSKRKLLLLQLNSQTIATMYYQYSAENPTFCKSISTLLAQFQDNKPPENSWKKNKWHFSTPSNTTSFTAERRVIMGSEAPRAASPYTGKLANLSAAKKSQTPELIYFGMWSRGSIPDHVERRNCLMQFHTVKPKISTTSETLKLESMRFQTSLNRAPAPARNNLDLHQLLGKKWLFLHLD